MNATLRRTEKVAENIQTFWFEPDKAVDYLAGQFVEMYLPHKNADARGQKHWFTLSSSPTEEYISITTKYALGRASTFKQQLFALKPGAKVRISEPMGDFVLPKDKSIPLLFVAGGIGITPMRSMVKWLTDSKEQRDVSLIYGVKTPDELAFLDLFKSYGIVPEILASKPNTGWPGRKGHIASGLIMDSVTHEEQLIYISGPEPMTEKLEADLLATGIEPQRLVLDFFPGYQPV